MQDLEIIILAGGKGKRMGGDKPKVLTEIKGRPMISYVLGEVNKFQSNSPIVVLGYKAEDVKKNITNESRTAIQTEQLGTGHAVSCALPFLNKVSKYVMVLYGDHPLVDAETISKIYNIHKQQNKSPITLATIKVSDFLDWRAPFYDFGRIIRGSNGEIESIVEKKDSNDDQLKITELNPSYFCFNKDWLIANISKIQNNNSQKEFYLTDLVGLAQSQGYHLNSCEIDTHKALGVNTPEQLALVTQFIR